MIVVWRTVIPAQKPFSPRSRRAVRSNHRGLQIKFRAKINFASLGVIGEKFRAAGHQNLSLMDDVATVN
jgi:hypothetical protein